MPLRAQRETDLDWLKQLRFFVKAASEEGTVDKQCLYALDRAIDNQTANVFTEGAVGRITAEVLHVRGPVRRGRSIRKLDVEQQLGDQPSGEDADDGTA